MSATPDTPLSLREARQRERQPVHEARCILQQRRPFSAKAREEYERALAKGCNCKVGAARRATDEALVRAVLRHAGRWVEADWSLLDAGEIAAVLDAVEREETER